MKRCLYTWCAAALLNVWVAAVAYAQPWPARPVRLVVPFGPGGAADIIARILGERLALALGQTVVIDNRPGASGTIATEIVARPPPDGYTIGTQWTTSFTYAVHVFGAKLPYHPVRDFTPITRVALVPLMLVVHPGVPAKSMRELADHIKARPGKVSYASFGYGSTPHVAGELFRLAAGLDCQHVPYKGSGQAHPDLLGGQVQLMFDTVLASVGYVRNGRLRAIAVTSPRRLGNLPDVPTATESGMPGFEVGSWLGIVGPAGMPAPVVARLSQEIIKAVQTPETRARLLDLGADVVAEPPAVFAAFIRKEVDSFGKFVRDAGLKFE
jgi:tripartite-type tricarboxylate transporter receptor subunit TctC